MNKDSLCSSKSQKPSALNFPPLPKKRNLIIMGSLSQIPGHGPLHAPIPHYPPELGNPHSAFATQNLPPNLQMGGGFQAGFPRHRFGPNSFVRDPRSPALPFRKDPIEQKSRRRPSIEKKLEVPSTKENFTKSSKKPFLGKLDGSFEKLPHSNPSIAINSTSFPNLDEITCKQFPGNSFLDFNARSPKHAKPSFGAGVFNPAHFGRVPSVNTFLQPQSEHDVKLFKFPNFKNVDKPTYFDSHEPAGNISTYNPDPLPSDSFARNMLSFNNLEVVKNQPSDFSKNLTPKEYPFKVGLPSFEKKFPFSGRFTSMNRLDSTKELESLPLLGKRDKPESQIRLPSLCENLHKLDEPEAKNSGVDERVPEPLPTETRPLPTVQDKMMKPNSTTSLESRPVSTF